MWAQGRDEAVSAARDLARELIPDLRDELARLFRMEPSAHPKAQLKYLGELWDEFPALVTRSEARKITGGVISKRTLELDDQHGRGPTERVWCNGKLAYPKLQFLLYLESKEFQVVKVKPGP